MNQSRISPDLGPLPRTIALKADHNRTSNLLQNLRSLALKNQREQPRVFYSLREVATRFKVPVSTVAKVYHDLEQEGLLSRVRSSKTILNGLRHNRKLSIRSFVGLPVLTSYFITMPEYRMFFICIQRALWLRGFAATMVFFRPEEAAQKTLSDQLKAHEVDTVIWLQPGRTAKETLLRLSDMGIRVIVISEVGTPGIPSRYFVWKEHAIEALLKDWKNRNLVSEITIVNSRGYRSAVTEEIVRVILQSLGIKTVIRTFQDENSSVFLRDLCHTKTEGIIFPTSGLVSMFAFRSPDAMADLIGAQRVAFVDGLTDIPFAPVPEAPVDLVMVNWQVVTESIVDDLITRDAFDRNRHTAFEAELHLKTSLRRFCDEIHPWSSMPPVLE